MCAFSVGRPQRGNIHAELGLQFNNVASPDQIPQADAVADTLISALNNPNNTFGLAVDPTSIQVIRSTTGGSTTTTGPTTSGGTAAPSPVVVLAATLEEAFVEELNNRSSVQYRDLETRVETAFDSIFSERFGLLFIRTFVIGFRPQRGNIHAELGLQFNNVASPDQIPQADAVADTLISALNNPNNTFGLAVDPTSIQVIRSTTGGSTTTTGPTTSGGTAAPSPVVVLAATLEEAFVEELNNRSSAQYRDLETRVETAVHTT
ncbi:uncharacterized protein LOC122870673 [Siniperca chuatsi]|uniref:uncharacterized protein LOC122870673 n=1 Tax=Siniperca chuatsi TaxID=119488 RepID=UPI001CE1A050|nr:uncharacterized protein LOC122870673 [Siniperca chuatsi]